MTPIDDPGPLSMLQAIDQAAYGTPLHDDRIAAIVAHYSDWYRAQVQAASDNGVKWWVFNHHVVTCLRDIIRTMHWLPCN